MKTHSPDLVAELLLELRERNLWVFEHEGKLVAGPKDSLTANDRAEIALLKPDILCELRAARSWEFEDLLVRILRAYPGVLQAEVNRGLDDEWHVEVVFDKAHDLVEGSFSAIRASLCDAVARCTNESTARYGHVRETAWFNSSFGEPPYYFLYITGPALHRVAPEAMRRARKRRESPPRELDPSDMEQF